MRRSSFEVRCSDEEKLVFEQAAGPRRLSEWVRVACREKLEREGGGGVERVSAQAHHREARPTPPRPARLATRRHHPRCVCEVCRAA